MRRYLEFFSAVILSLFTLPLLAQSVPEFAYDSAPNLPKLPADIFLGEAAGVAQNSKRHMFVFTRSGETQLFEFDREGNYVREISPRNYAFAFAHTVRVDPQDNVWAVDEGTNMIVKFNPAGKVVGLTLRAICTGVGGPWAGWIRPGQHQCLYSSNSTGTTDMSDNGEIYKMELDGLILGEFGRGGKQLKEFMAVHEIDCRNENEIYVGEISNWRVQKLTLHPAK